MKSVLQVFCFDLVAKILLGGAAIVLIRYMPEHEYATYTFALALSTVVSQTITSTFNRIYIIGYDDFQARHELSGFLGLQIWGIAALSLALIPLASQLGAAYFFAAGLAAASCLAEYCKTGLQQAQRFFAYSMAELGRAVATAGSVLVLGLVYGYSVPAEGILLAQALAIGALFLVLFHRSIGFAGVFRIRSAAGLATTIARGEYRWLLGYFLVLPLFGQVDVFMLKALASSSELASYGAAFRYYSLLSLALAAVHAVLLPVIRQLNSTEELRRVIAKHRMLTLALIPLVLLLGWIAEWLLPWIDLGKYPQSVDVFRVLCASAVISFAFSPHVNVVIRYERFPFLFFLIICALVVAVLLNWFLISQAGAVGAAWATLAANAFVTVPIYFLSKRLTATAHPPT